MIRKVLLANKYFFKKGGADISFFETAALLERKGHPVVYFSMRHAKNLPCAQSRYFVSGVDYETGGVASKLRAAGRLLYSFEARRNIERLIRDERPDIAHLNNIYHQISPSILHTLKKYGIPIVMTLRDYKVVCASYTLLAGGKICEACKGGKYHQCFLKACVKGSRTKSFLSTIEMYLHHDILRLYKLVDVFISPSLFLKQKVEEMGLKASVVYLPNFTNLTESTFEPVTPDNSIVYFGRLSREKGLDTLITAVQGLDIKLKIIGDGPLRAALVNRVSRESIKNIEFMGHRTGEDLRGEILKSWFVVLPSEWYENNPRTLIEGFALGKPAVASRIGGIPELIKDHVTGLTYEAGNSLDLKEKLCQLLGKADEITAMGHNARKKVVEDFNPEVHYRRLISIYESAAAKN